MLMSRVGKLAEMTDPGDPSLLSYPALPPSTLDDTPSHNSLIDLSSPDPPPSSGGTLFTLAPGTTPLNSTGLVHQTTPNSTGLAHQTTSTVPITDFVHHQHSALHSIHNPQAVTPQITTSADPLILRVQYLEQLCGKLQREKKDSQEDFGRQRKKYMERLLEMESQAMLVKNTNERYANEIREISTQLLAKDEELNNVRLASKMSEKQAREDFDADRVKYEEEIASLQKILAVQTQDQTTVLSSEREAWKKERDSLVAEIQRLKTLSTARRTQSPTNLPLKGREVVPRKQFSSSHSPEGQAENMEVDMAKAALDAEVLRSVVVPLEKELEQLRGHLKEAREQLAEYEAKAQAPPPQTTPSLIDFDTPADTDAVSQLQAQLKLERSARQDLEMHTEALVAQKTLTHQEILVLSHELEKYKERYKTEAAEHSALKTEHTSLRKTWELANQHFMVESNVLKQQIHSLNEQLGRITTTERKKSTSSPASEGSVPGGVSEGVEDVRVRSMAVVSTHKRSQSSVEDEADPHGPLQRKLSMSLPTLEQLLDGAPAESGDGVSLEQRLSTLLNENNSLHEELSRKSKLCVSYESQLQRVQSQMLEEMDEKERDIDRLRAEIEKLKAGIMRERETQKNLRRAMKEDVEAVKVKLDGFREMEKRVRQDVRKRKDNFTELKQDTQMEIARLTEDKRESQRQLEAAREEYDCLKVLQTQQMTEYQQALDRETQARKEAEMGVKAIKTHLAAAQDRLQSTEVDLCSQLSLVQEQLRNECQQREKLSAELTSQLASSMRANDGLQSLKVDIEAERRAKEEALSSKQSIQEKSTAFIQEQQTQIEKLHKEKELQEKQIVELTRQISSLKHQLDRTSETQKDFVELSQSLQIRLAEMEESQKSTNSSESVS